MTTRLFFGMITSTAYIMFDTFELQIKYDYRIIYYNSKRYYFIQIRRHCANVGFMMYVVSKQIDMNFEIIMISSKINKTSFIVLWKEWSKSIAFSKEYYCKL